MMMLNMTMTLTGKTFFPFYLFLFSSHVVYCFFLFVFFDQT